MTRYLVGLMVGRHLELYKRVPIGLLQFRAYAVYRRAGQPLPESLLAKFDEYAKALEAATNEHEVAAAIEMENKQRKTARARLAAIEGQRDVVEDVLFQQQVFQAPPNDAAHVVARDRGLTFVNVKKIKSSWKTAGSKSKPPKAKPSAGSDLQATWTKKRLRQSSK